MKKQIASFFRWLSNGGDVARIGPDTADDSLVICPACTSQFRAIPIDVQREARQLRHHIAWAWSIIANVSQGDWSAQEKSWRDAATAWESARNPYAGLDGEAKQISRLLLELQEIRNQRDMYKAQRADWKAVADSRVSPHYTETQVREFCGFITGYLNQLHHAHPGEVWDAWCAYIQSSGLRGGSPSRWPAQSISLTPPASEPRYIAVTNPQYADFLAKCRAADSIKSDALHTVLRECWRALASREIEPALVARVEEVMATRPVPVAHPLPWDAPLESGE